MDLTSLLIPNRYYWIRTSIKGIIGSWEIAKYVGQKSFQVCGDEELVQEIGGMEIEVGGILNEYR